uniref:Multiple epidermal growth factor-like domains 6 n=1 Tax=Magallana gigas TaxID=29159 RepID=A0A8W8JES9_MAGGI
MNIVLDIAVLFVLVHAEDDLGTRPDYCNDGYKGVFCENRCPYPTFGSQCSERCHCSIEFCDHTSGCRAPAENCSVGFMGKYCKEMCRFPKYGYGCQQNCLCPKSYCHFEKGCIRKKLSPKNLNRKDLLFEDQPDEEESTIKPYSPSTTYTPGESFIIMVKKRKTDCRYCL